MSTSKTLNPDNILIDAGEAFFSTVGVAPRDITPLAAPAPTSQVFAVATQDANVLDGLKHLMVLSGTAVLYGLTEASTMPRIGSVAPGLTAGIWLVTMEKPFPTAPTAGAGMVKLVWRALGANGDPISIGTDITSQKFYAQQSLSPVKSRRTQRDVTIQVPCIEITLEQLALAYGSAPPAAGATIIEIGPIDGGERIDRVLIRGQGTEAAYRYYLYFAAINSGSASQVLGKDNMQQVLVEWETYLTSNNHLGRPLEGLIGDFAT